MLRGKGFRKFVGLKATRPIQTASGAGAREEDSEKLLTVVIMSGLDEHRRDLALAYIFI